MRPTALAGLDSVSGASSLFGFADGAWELVVLRPQRGFGSAFLGFGVHVARAASPRGAQAQMIGTLLSTVATVGVSSVFAFTVGLTVAGWSAF